MVVDVLQLIVTICRLYVQLSFVLLVAPVFVCIRVWQLIATHFVTELFGI